MIKSVWNKLLIKDRTLSKLNLKPLTFSNFLNNIKINHKILKFHNNLMKSNNLELTLSSNFNLFSNKFYIL